MENTQCELELQQTGGGGTRLLKLNQNLRTCDGVIICNSLQIFELRKEPLNSLGTVSHSVLIISVAFIKTK